MLDRYDETLPTSTSSSSRSLYSRRPCLIPTLAVGSVKLLPVHIWLILWVLTDPKDMSTRGHAEISLRNSCKLCVCSDIQVC